MPSMTANSALLLSIFPIEVEASRLHNGFVTYLHPVAQKDKIIKRTFNTDILSTIGGRPDNPRLFTDEVTDAEAGKGYVLLRVWDTFIWTRDFTQEQERFIPHPVNAKVVADDLYGYWTGDVIRPSGQFGPGMKVITTEEPTPEDLGELRRHQEGYFRSLINDAHYKHARGDNKDISDLHRAAAKWMGANNLPWVPKIEEVELKSCRACGNQIRSEALRCQFCQADLLDFYRKHQLEPDPLEDRAVWMLLQRKPPEAKGANAIKAVQ